MSESKRRNIYLYGLRLVGIAIFVTMVYRADWPSLQARLARQLGPGLANTRLAGLAEKLQKGLGELVAITWGQWWIIALLSVGIWLVYYLLFHILAYWAAVPVSFIETGIVVFHRLVDYGSAHFDRRPGDAGSGADLRLRGSGPARERCAHVFHPLPLHSH